MKKVRKWSRILHRDIGFFFIGTTILYGLSGIALNHMSDWNPNYAVELRAVQTNLQLEKSQNSASNISLFLEEINLKKDYKKHYYPSENKVKIFLKGGSSIVVNTRTGKGMAEFLKRRPVFFEANFLHYNPNRIWTWFSDVFAGALLLFAITSLFMVKGKKGVRGRGGIYLALGILLPILFLIIYV